MPGNNSFTPLYSNINREKEVRFSNLSSMNSNDRPTTQLPSRFFTTARPQVGVPKLSSTSKPEVRSKLAHAVGGTSLDQERRMRNAANALKNLSSNTTPREGTRTYNPATPREGTRTYNPANNDYAAYSQRSSALNFNSPIKDHLNHATKFSPNKQEIPVLNPNYQQDRDFVIPAILRKAKERGDNNRYDTSNYRSRNSNDNVSRHTQNSNLSNYNRRNPHDNGETLKSMLYNGTSKLFNSLFGKDSERETTLKNDYRAKYKADFLSQPPQLGSFAKADNSNTKDIFSTHSSRHYNSFDRKTEIDSVFDELQQLKKQVKDLLNEKNAPSYKIERRENVDNKTTDSESLIEKLKKEKEQIQLEKEKIRLQKELAVEHNELEDRENKREIQLLRKLLAEKNKELESYKKRKREDDYADMNAYSNTKLAIIPSTKKRRRVIKYVIEEDSEQDEEEDSETDKEVRVSMSPGLRSKVSLDKADKLTKYLTEQIDSDLERVEKMSSYVAQPETK